MGAVVGGLTPPAVEQSGYHLSACIPLAGELLDAQADLRARNIQRDLVAPGAQLLNQLRVLIKQALEFCARSAGIALQSCGKGLQFLWAQMGKQPIDVAL
ncbi:hypothetical protein D3C84_305930 [compost metagenome]